MVGPAVIGAAALAAGAGSSLVNLAFAPLFAANQYIGSYFFGSGMILGERDMYQEDWPKIKARLDAGESFAAILEEQTIRNTTAIMANAKDIVLQVKTEWNQIVFDYLRTMPQAILDLLGIPAPGSNIPDPGNCPEGFKWDSIQGRCRPIPVGPDPKPTPSCPPGFQWSQSAQQCVPIKAPNTNLTKWIWLEDNSQGRLNFRTSNQGNQWILDSNVQGHWTKVRNYGNDLVAGIQAGISIWSSKFYKQFGIKKPGESRNTIYWYLKTKTLP